MMNGFNSSTVQMTVEGGVPKLLVMYIVLIAGRAGVSPKTQIWHADKGGAVADENGSWKSEKAD